jgi:hypothetical protein
MQRVGKTYRECTEDFFYISVYTLLSTTERDLKSAGYKGTLKRCREDEAIIVHCMPLYNVML